nr:MAG TPA: hypothetical protein [Caudoviricetes sp.]
MKINFRIKTGWKEATTTEKIVGIATWIIIFITIAYFIWR